MPAEYTVAAFQDLCRRAAHLPVFCVGDYLRAGPQPPAVIFRFDVDYRSQHAVRLASILARRGLRGTFYFRRHPAGFNHAAIRAVAALGHEIGYHYETLDRCGGDFLAARAMLQQDIDDLRRNDVTVETIAAHGTPPLAPGYAGNLDLVRRDPGLVGQLGLLGDAVLSVDFTRLCYFSDAGWHWTRHDGTPPGPGGRPSTLAEVGACLAHPETSVYLTFHPHQWFERAAVMHYFRWRNRVGMVILPRLRALRRA